MNDEHAEQVVECLLGIGAELTAIRQELQATNDTGPSPETLICRLCGEDIPEPQTERHAVEEHGAPRDGWQATYE